MEYNVTSVAVETSQSGWFSLSIALILLCSLLAIYFNLLLALTLWKTSIVQYESKILLTNLSLSAVIFSITQIFSNVKLIFRIANRLSLSLSIRDCLAENLPKAISAYSLVASMIFVAWERAEATRNYRSYESKPHFYPILCVFISWAIPSIVFFGGFFTSPTDKIIPICYASLAYSSTLVTGYLLFNLLLGLLTLLLFSGICYVNRKKLSFYLYNQAHLSLSERFQLANNLEITDTLLPSVILHIVMCGSANSLICFVAYNFENTKVITKLAILSLQYSNVLGTTYGLLHPMVVILKNERLRCLTLPKWFKQDSNYFTEIVNMPSTH